MKLIIELNENEHPTNIIFKMKLIAMLLSKGCNKGKSPDWHIEYEKPHEEIMYFLDEAKCQSEKFQSIINNKIVELLPMKTKSEYFRKAVTEISKGA